MAVGVALLQEDDHADDVIVGLADRQARGQVTVDRLRLEIEAPDGVVGVVALERNPFGDGSRRVTDDIVQKPARLARVARDFGNAALVVVQLLERHDRQKDVVLLEPEQAGRVVHQDIGVQDEQLACGIAAASRGARTRVWTQMRAAAGSDSSRDSVGFNKIEHLLSVAWNLTPRHSRLITRSRSRTKVLRSMPRTFLPYMFFIFMTPNWLQIFSLSSESSSKGNSILALKFSCDLRLSRETPYTAQPGLHEPGMQVAKLRSFGGAARGVVLRIEVENHPPGFDRREPEFVSAGGGQCEIAYRFVGHPLSAFCCSRHCRANSESGCKAHVFKTLCEECYKLAQQFRWRLLREVVAAVERAALNALGALRPIGERLEAALDRSVLAPQHEQRAGELARDDRPRRAPDRSTRRRGNPRSSRGSPPDRESTCGTRPAPRARTPSSPACRVPMWLSR